MVQHFRLQIKNILDLEGGRPQVRQVNGEVREYFLGLVVGNGGVNDDIFALLPVDGSGDLVLIADLKS